MEQTKFPDLLAQAKRTSAELSGSVFGEIVSYMDEQVSASLVLPQLLTSSLSDMHAKTPATGTLFNEVLEGLPQTGNSILAFGSRIKQLLQQGPLKVSRLYPYSEAAWLAIYLRRAIQAPKVYLYGDHKSVRAWSRIAPSTATDKQTVSLSILTQQKVQYSSFEAEQCEISSLIVLDLFLLDRYAYSHFLIRNREKLAVAKQLIVLYHPQQEQQVSGLLKKCGISVQQTSIDFMFPRDIVEEPNEQEALKALQQFLLADSGNGIKQDVMIFYPQQHMLSNALESFKFKLKALLSQDKALNAVVLVDRPNNTLNKNSSHIFIVRDSSEASLWNYDYNKVFYILDFCEDMQNFFDYVNGCFCQEYGRACIQERVRRMSYCGVFQPGKYCYLNLLKDQHPEILPKEDVVKYVLKLVKRGQCDFLSNEDNRVKQCTEYLKQLKVLEEANGSLCIKSDLVLQLIDEGLQPLTAVMLEQFHKKEGNNHKLMNTAAIFAATFQTKTSLRVESKGNHQKSAVSLPTLWRQADYFASCMNIVMLTEKIQQKEKSNSLMRKKTSQAAKLSSEMFGGIFEDAPFKIKTVEDMNVPQFLKYCQCRQQVWFQLLDRVDTIRETLNIEPLTQDFDEAVYRRLTEVLAEVSPLSVACYTNNRRTGYSMKNESGKILTHRSCLLSLANLRPPFLFITHLCLLEGKREVLRAAHIDPQTYVSVYGQLPQVKAQSTSEGEVEFFGISTAAMRALWKFNGAEITHFENTFNCCVEPNQELARITVTCNRDRETEIKEAFQKQIDKVRAKLANCNKILNYFGSTTISIGKGGQVIQLLKGSHLQAARMSNIDLSATIEDIEDILEDEVKYKSIVFEPVGPGKAFKSAIIQLTTTREYYNLAAYYHDCLFYGRFLKVLPIVTEAPKIPTAGAVVEFVWFVWKSLGEALIEFKQVTSADEFCKSLAKQARIDGAEVEFKQEGKKVTLTLQPQTDEITLERVAIPFGVIERIEILRKPTEEPQNDFSRLENQIRLAMQNPNGQNGFKAGPVQAKKNGMRRCTVEVLDIPKAKEISLKMDQKIGMMGHGKLHAATWFNQPVFVPKGFLPVYSNLLEDVVKLQIPNSIIETQTVQIVDGRQFLILRSPIMETANLALQKLVDLSKGASLLLTGQETNRIFSEYGLSTLFEIEELFNCKIVPDFLNKKIVYIGKRQDHVKILEQVSLKAKQDLLYRLPLNSVGYKHIKENKDILTHLQSTYFLTCIELEELGRSIIMEGSAKGIEGTLNYLTHLIESLTTPQEKMINTQACLICCEEPHKPYRLQACGHKFCSGCLQRTIESTLGDLAMFPIRCPHCRVEVVLDDLDSLIDENTWLKVREIAINAYMVDKKDQLTFCCTVGCKQINYVQLDHFECDSCNRTYCFNCKNDYHPNMTCQQAKHNVDALFEKYLAENDVRKCPNDKCRMPIVRIDGCFRVTCSRCDVSMCFKCDAKSMKAYPNYNDCYKHLTDEHGGYW